jgi:DNA-directed RNA polymerase subunit E'/Rpb7
MSNKSTKTLKGIYMQNILSRKIILPFVSLGNNIKELLSQKISSLYEGKCIKEGFIKKRSCSIVSYSAGIIKNKNVIFSVIFECLICRPSEGMKFKVNVKNITKAGIRAEYKEDSPIVVFIARDHIFKNKNINNIKIGDMIYIKVIGIRYELNDEFISIIADLDDRKVKRPKITINN